MMQQYLQTKEEYKDCILFYRLGDFYEMFFEDAELVSKELELTLTGKNCGMEERAPMCGIPYHAVEGYLNKLVANGHKVAICEQVEDRGHPDRDAGNEPGYAGAGRIQEQLYYVHRVSGRPLRRIHCGRLNRRLLCHRGGFGAKAFR